MPAACGAVAAEMTQSVDARTSLLPEVSSSSGDIAFGNHDGIALHVCSQRNRIAATRLPNRLWVDWRGAIVANQAGRRLGEALRATDLASVKNRSHFAVGFAIEQEADFGAVLHRRITMQVAISKICRRNRGHTVHKRHRRGRRRCTSSLGVYELRRHQKNEDKRTAINRAHPQTLATGCPLSLTTLGTRLRFERLRRTPALLEQDHERGQRQYGHKEKHVIAHDRADPCHLALRRGQYTVF